MSGLYTVYIVEDIAGTTGGCAFVVVISSVADERRPVSDVPISFAVLIDSETGTDTITRNYSYGIAQAKYKLTDCGRFVADVAFDAAAAARGTVFGARDGSVVWSTFDDSVTADRRSLDSLSRLANGRFVDPSILLRRELPTLDRTMIYGTAYRDQARSTHTALHFLSVAAEEVRRILA